MATLLAHITVRSGSESRFEEIACDLHERTHADEDAVLRYEYWRGADERTYYSLLAFPDHHSFLVHQTSGHHEEASPAIGAVVESIRLEWADPISGASDLPPTNSQPAPEGADELTTRYAASYAAQVADWWLALR